MNMDIERGDVIGLVLGKTNFEMKISWTTGSHKDRINSRNPEFSIFKLKLATFGKNHN